MIQCQSCPVVVTYVIYVGLKGVLWVIIGCIGRRWCWNFELFCIRQLPQFCIIIIIKLIITVIMMIIIIIIIIITSTVYWWCKSALLKHGGLHFGISSWAVDAQKYELLSFPITLYYYHAQPDAHSPLHGHRHHYTPYTLPSFPWGRSPNPMVDHHGNNIGLHLLVGIGLFGCCCACGHVAVSWCDCSVKTWTDSRANGFCSKRILVTTLSVYLNHILFQFKYQIKSA